MSEGRRTPFYQWHQDQGARLIDFYGWHLPLEYQGITAEVEHTRSGAGLFDVSHMGRILVEGRDALDYLNRLVTVDLSDLNPGRVRYALLLNQRGGTVDDIMVYCLAAGRYWLVGNASNREKDLDWLGQHATGTVAIRDLTFDHAQVALQGPRSQEILEALAETGDSPGSCRPYTFVSQLLLAGVECLVSRTGYTGEDGFEVYCAANHARQLWEALTEVRVPGAAAVPVGLGARDVLRLEAGLPLYGCELDEDISPLEAGLDRFVSWRPEKEFIGREALEEEAARGLSRRRMGILLGKSGIPRAGYTVTSQGQEIGRVSSGTYSPTLEGGIGMAFLLPRVSPGEREVEVVVRGKPRPARVVSLPFFRREPR